MLELIILAGGLFILYQAHTHRHVNMDIHHMMHHRKIGLEHIKQTGIHRELADRRVTSGGEHIGRHFSHGYEDRQFPIVPAGRQSAFIHTIFNKVYDNEVESRSILDKTMNTNKPLTRDKNMYVGGRLTTSLTPISTDPQKFKPQVWHVANDF